MVARQLCACARARARACLGGVKSKNRDHGVRDFFLGGGGRLFGEEVSRRIIIPTNLVWSVAEDTQPAVVLSAQTVTGPSSRLNRQRSEPAPYSSVKCAPTSVSIGPASPWLAALPISKSTGVDVGKTRSSVARGITGPARDGG
jgi:hypothetical protein